MLPWRSRNHHACVIACARPASGERLGQERPFLSSGMGILPMVHGRDARATSRAISRMLADKARQTVIAAPDPSPANDLVMKDRFLAGAFDEDNPKRVIARSVRRSNQPLPTAPASVSLAQIELIASLEDSLLAMTVAEAVNLT